MDEKKNSIFELNGFFVLTAILIALFLLELIANPTGDFPLNDDWSFAVGVKNLLETGKLTLTSWTLAAAIFHVGSAALFSKIFGFSFELLRIYSGALALNSLWMVSILLRRLNVDWLRVLILTLLVASNALFFCLANSFMMDLATASIALSSIVLLSRLRSENASERQSNRDYLISILAALLAALAVSNRQVMIVVPLAFLLCGKLFKASKLESFLPLIFSTAFIAIHSYWLNNFVGIPFCMTVEKAYLTNMFSGGPILIFISFLMSLLRLIIYLGLLLLPMALFTFPTLLRGLPAKSRALTGLITLELAILLPIGLLLTKNIMPLGDNLIYDFGLGPILLVSDKLPLPLFVRAAGPFWQIVTIVSGIGAALLLGTISGVMTLLNERRHHRTWRMPESLVLMILVTAVIYSLAICFRGFFDRYLVFLIVLMPVVFAYPLIAFRQDRENDSPGASDVSNAGAQKNEAKLQEKVFQYSCYALAAFSALVLASYTVLGTHDYFAWNRARWQALNYAMHELQVAPALINGGYEFNHWFVYEPGNKKVDITCDDEPRGNDQYLISMEPIAGSYELQKEFPFNSYFWGKRVIYLSRKSEQSQP